MLYQPANNYGRRTVMSMYRCAACGSPKVVQDVQTGGIQFKYLKGAIGDVVLGPGGAVAGIENGQTIVYKCPDCGITLTYPMPSNIKTAIDMGVQSIDARRDLFVDGFLFDWNALKSMFINIESGLADQSIEQEAAISERLLTSFANASREDFDKAIDRVRNFWTKTGYYDGSTGGTNTTIRFSKENPPTLAEYLDYKSSSRLIVFNLSKYLPPPCPTEYRGLKSYDYFGLFSSYVLDELKKFCFEQYDYVDDAYRFYRKDTSNYLEFLANDPFTINFLRMYDNSNLFTISRAYAGFDEPITALTSRGPGHNGTTVFASFLNNAAGCSHDYYSITFNSDQLYSGSKWGQVYVPRYIVKDGRLGWLPGFKNMGDNFYELNKKYLDCHPDIKEAFYADLDKHKEDIAQKQKLSEINIAKSKVLQESDKAKDEISKHYVQIRSLESKIFGKAKAREEIERRKGYIEELNKKRAGFEEKIKEYDAFKREYKEANDSTSYYNSLFAKYDYLVEREWVDPSILPQKEDLPVEEATGRNDSLSKTDPVPSSSANEIREFKKLLDEGIITQEEFDAKKKQLLGL